MISNVSNALSAYQHALSRMGTQNSAIEAQEMSNSTASFGSMVKDVVENTVNLNKQAEQVTISGINGKADIQDVVQAISNAQMALETVVAVRDTAVKAYQSIIQMQI